MRRSRSLAAANILHRCRIPKKSYSAMFAKRRDEKARLLAHYSASRINFGYAMRYFSYVFYNTLGTDRLRSVIFENRVGEVSGRKVNVREFRERRLASSTAYTIVYSRAQHRKKTTYENWKTDSTRNGDEKRSIIGFWRLQPRSVA